MHVTRFHTTADGGSAFDEFDVPLDEYREDEWGNGLRFSEAFASPAVRVYPNAGRRVPRLAQRTNPAALHHVGGDLGDRDDRR